MQIVDSSNSDKELGSSARKKRGHQDDKLEYRKINHSGR